MNFGGVAYASGVSFETFTGLENLKPLLVTVSCLLADTAVIFLSVVGNTILGVEVAGNFVTGGVPNEK